MKVKDSKFKIYYPSTNRTHRVFERMTREIANSGMTSGFNFQAVADDMTLAVDSFHLFLIGNRSLHNTYRKKDGK